MMAMHRREPPAKRVMKLAATAAVGGAMIAAAAALVPISGGTIATAAPADREEPPAPPPPTIPVAAVAYEPPAPAARPRPEVPVALFGWEGLGVLLNAESADPKMVIGVPVDPTGSAEADIDGERYRIFRSGSTAHPDELGLGAPVHGVTVVVLVSTLRSPHQWVEAR